jgi:hypothetical protein
LFSNCPSPIVQSESEFRGGIGGFRLKKRTPLPFRLRPYKVKKKDENGKYSAKIVKNRKK